MSTFGDFFSGLVGGPKTTTTDTTVTSKPSTNLPMIIGGIVLGIAAVVGIAWALGAFKSKPKATAAA